MAHQGDVQAMLTVVHPAFGVGRPRHRKTAPKNASDITEMGLDNSDTRRWVDETHTRELLSMILAGVPPNIAPLRRRGSGGQADARTRLRADRRGS